MTQHSLRLAGLALAFLVAGGRANGQEQALLPVADTYVRANQNTTKFGTATSIVANNANGVRVFLVRFDLSGITEPISRLRFELTPNAGNTGNEFHVYGLVNGESWSETQLTWQTSPGVNQAFTGLGASAASYLNFSDLRGNGTPLATFASASSGTVVGFDVTTGPVFDFIAADADKVVTFLVAETDPSDNSGDAFNSREAATGKPTLLVFTGELPPPPPPPQQATLLHVVLQAGQSNADGRAAGSGLPSALQQPQENVVFYYHTFGAAANSDGTLGKLTTLRPGATQMPAGGFGPEITLGSNLAPAVEQRPGHKLAIIKYAKGGSTLVNDWKAGGDSTLTNDGPHYVTFQTVVKNGLARLAAEYPDAEIRLAGMVWVQGESDIDSGSGPSSAYGTNLTRFIADVRSTFGATLPFFFTRISSHQTVYSTPTDPNYQDYLTLRQQQASVADTVPGAYMIDTDGPEISMNSDNLHFSPVGQQEIGKAFARSLQEISLLRVLSFAREGGGFRLRWNAIPGRSYTIQVSPDLVEWAAPFSVGAVSEWTEASIPDVPSRFYRVMEEQNVPVAAAAAAAAAAAVPVERTAKRQKRRTLRSSKVQR